MENNLNTKTSCILEIYSKTSNQESETISVLRNKIKAATVPIYPAPVPSVSDENKLKPQISAPSYLYSLDGNELPPHIKPTKEPRPHLLIGTIMDEAEAFAMISASDADPVNGLNSYLGKFLVEKRVILNYNLKERKFLISLLKETIDYAANCDFKAFKLACLITIYLSAHMYFKWYYWTTPEAVWSYFKETMIRHSIEDSPDGQDVFEPQECFDIITHFHAMYMNNLPLVHILTFGSCRLKYVWPFKFKKV